MCHVIINRFLDLQHALLDYIRLSQLLFHYYSGIKRVNPFILSLERKYISGAVLQVKTMYFWNLLFKKIISFFFKFQQLFARICQKKDEFNLIAGIIVIFICFYADLLPVKSSQDKNQNYIFSKTAAKYMQHTCKEYLEELLCQKSGKYNSFKNNIMDSKFSWI